MKKSEFRIRDPFVLFDEGKYYMYGTTSFADNGGCTRWSFDVYVSDNLEDFSGPYTVLEPRDGFFGKSDFWAPEVHKYKGKFYMLATFKGEESKNHGVGILVADSPLGPFTPHSEMPITPKEWSALDGTLYIDESGEPYMVFCHEWWSMGEECDGTMCYARLSDDLTHFITEPVTMFAASESPFVRITSRGYGYITDGPCMYRTDTGELLMLWSSKGERGYMECIHRSSNGSLDGDFLPVSVLYADDGGHGMIFKSAEGELLFTCHTPNTTGKERAAIFPLIDLGDDLLLKI
ncbi:MAG: family 43 glycosylhydrolase [Clostridia bacterium]|nr:family 43 glycosylhydrolase [Clostridia bacterium]